VLGAERTSPPHRRAASAPVADVNGQRAASTGIGIGARGRGVSQRGSGGGAHIIVANSIARATWKKQKQISESFCNGVSASCVVLHVVCCVLSAVLYRRSQCRKGLCMIRTQGPQTAGLGCTAQQHAVYRLSGRVSRQQQLAAAARCCRQCC
jgi:hypothetical protein